MIDLGAFSLRFLKVWKRNLVTYRRIWKVNFIPPCWSHCSTSSPLVWGSAE